MKRTGSGKKRIRRLTKKQRERQIVIRTVLVTVCVMSLLLLTQKVVRVYLNEKKAQAAAVAETEQEAAKQDPDHTQVERPELDVELLTLNEYSRPGIALAKVNGVVVHYTANPGATAIANRNYFESLMDSHVTKASSHFIVGLEGEIVQCIPCSEISYASNDRNSDTISIECCIEDETGKFNQATYAAVVHLTAWLVERYDLEVEDVIRHYDVTGKLCPKYYVEHPEAWEQFLGDVTNYLIRAGVAL